MDGWGLALWWMGFDVVLGFVGYWRNVLLKVWVVEGGRGAMKLFLMQRVRLCMCCS